MARTQKNKATSAHLGALKAKLAKLKRELITTAGDLALCHNYLYHSIAERTFFGLAGGKGGGGGAGEGFDVSKSGDARVGLIGTIDFAAELFLYLRFSNQPSHLVQASRLWANPLSCPN